MAHLEPRVWSTFESTRNGQKFKIRIERVTPELADAAIDHMVAYFLEREPITKYIRKFHCIKHLVFMTFRPPEITLIAFLQQN